METDSFVNKFVEQLKITLHYKTWLGKGKRVDNILYLAIIHYPPRYKLMRDIMKHAPQKEKGMLFKHKVGQEKANLKLRKYAKNFMEEKILSIISAFILNYLKTTILTISKNRLINFLPPYSDSIAIDYISTIYCYTLVTSDGNLETNLSSKCDPCGNVLRGNVSIVTDQEKLKSTKMST